jgi:hypothetical protein
MNGNGRLTSYKWMRVCVADGPRKTVDMFPVTARCLGHTPRNDEAARGLFPLIIKCSDQVE